VVAYDARGHGDSDWAADGDYGHAVMARDLKCVVEALHAARPVLVGASMGGGASLIAVGERFVDPAALVLVDIAPRLEAEGVARIRSFMTGNPDGFASLDEVADAISTYQRQRRRRRNLNGLAKNLLIGDDGRYRWHWDPRLIRSTQDLEERQKRLDACARSLSRPTLLVRGERSDMVTGRSVQEFRELCPHAEYAEIPEAGHMIAGQRNDAFAGAILGFLARVTPGTDLAKGPKLEQGA
jgi:non-heme chloroperoxidase